ncbi:hypothetical protein TWF696_000283 [Orbilia brochopaga]|uniref:Uncharacterized protein n=1 Tax=Orbilia brochopaga TaxID=3140254 RepID=A0AAV9VAT6_9PEZI
MLVPPPNCGNTNSALLASDLDISIETAAEPKYLTYGYYLPSTELVSLGPQGAAALHPYSTPREGQSFQEMSKSDADLCNSE